MKRTRKSKGVSWANGVNLCQVKLFSSEDCPSKVGQSSNHLQAKTSRRLPPYTYESNGCPPGFNVTCLKNQLADVSSIPLIKWNCPPKFAMSCHWCVAAGEESKELESQSFREMRLLEAVYPRVSDIPPGATVSTEIKNERYNDSVTPLVPIIPIEEEECEVMEADSAAVGNSAMKSFRMMSSNIQLEPAISKSSIETSAAAAAASGEMHTEKLPDVGVDVAAAASAALAVLMKSMEQGSMIDTNLLIKIFNDTTMIQNLTTILPLYEAAYGSPPSAAIAAPISLSKPVTASNSLPVPKSDTIQKLPNRSLPHGSVGVPSSVTTLPQVSNIVASGVKPAAVPVRGQTEPQTVKTTIPNARNYSNTGAAPGQVNMGPVSLVRTEGQQLKDLNYYKNLVRQHGEQKKDGKEQKFELNGNNHNQQYPNMVHEMKAGNLKGKIKKNCIYFNTPKGCRNGNDCQFNHDMSNPWRINSVLETQNSKRMKLWG
ncbi:zinc finger CCCH domain-containing protein 6-like [Cucurbita pepo subsp. pepo]|uniref:zinc finger CCCH domain-containing protein 6-like n=1 Tax=Cucurbita pepo subsp. pepo TaxID=3664 RepID=UPI000C9D8CC0|nr:zinc finger CCCH domain-containing protein 6-like [Cucurbita pepo subsp. pepo]